MKGSASILAFAGSARDASFNKKLVNEAATAAEKAGAAVTRVDMREYPIPLYDGDLEEREGLPEHAARLQALMESHSGFLMAAPEYNGSITPLLKNTIDWVTRTGDGQGTRACFSGKVIALMSASPGPLGGMRGLVHVRAILGGLGAIVLPEQVTVRNAYEAFDQSGVLADTAKQEAVAALAAQLVDVTRKLGVQ